mmetsp:Transcript_73758/g.149731  ORF Transcript_73758/g.149731 Transcript_73758/m.149731 type:complete len:80 (-) Transcript_73758:155-394(-)
MINPDSSVATVLFTSKSWKFPFSSVIDRIIIVSLAVAIAKFDCVSWRMYDQIFVDGLGTSSSYRAKKKKAVWFARKVFL